MNIGVVLIVLGFVLLILHAWVLPAIDQTISDRRPNSRFASEPYVAWRRQHRRASVIGALSVIALGGLVVALL
jgi:hypothetical protein